MTRDAAIAMIQKMHELRLLNDAEAVLPLFTEEATFCIAGTPRAGSVAATAQCVPTRALMAELVATWEWQDVAFHHILADGDTAIANYTLTLRHIPTDTSVTTQMMDLVRFEGDKIAVLTHYADTALLGAVAAGQAA